MFFLLSAKMEDRGPSSVKSQCRMFQNAHQGNGNMAWQRRNPLYNHILQHHDRITDGRIRNESSRGIITTEERRSPSSKKRNTRLISKVVPILCELRGGFAFPTMQLMQISATLFCDSCETVIRLFLAEPCTYNLSTGISDAAKIRMYQLS